MPDGVGVTVPVLPVAPFRSLVGEERFGALAGAADAAREALGGRAVLTVNSTASGGGVAEMLGRLVGYDRGLGLDARWSVIEADDAFFTVTKRLHHFLHGRPGDGGPLGPDERRVYDEVLRRNGERLAREVNAGDVVHLHDPQVAGLAPRLADAGARVVWQLHIGADEGDSEEGQRAWDFLAPDLEAVDVFVFSREAYVPAPLRDREVRIIPPSIDPFSMKNRPLDDPCAILRDAGLLADGPLIVQVSRWDPLKDMAGVMAGFAAASLDHARLVLAGPEVGSVTDDPESRGVYDDCVRRWRDLPGDVRARVQVVALPMDDPEQNAAIVNALQRHAAVVVQKSLAEGFGLTVTEAMWKARPVAASAVGGICDQIDDGVHGLLLRDPADPACLAGALERLLSDREAAEGMGEAAHQRVHAEYLDDRQLRQRLELYAEVAGRP